VRRSKSAALPLKDIRVVLNDRATAQGIRERLTWLAGRRAEDGTERVFFYSGHGAQMPGYSAEESVDHVDECLVPSGLRVDEGHRYR